MSIAGFKTVGIVGAGQMGNGIAQVCATQGLSVKLYDLSDEQLGKAKASITKSADKLLSKERITKEQHAGATSIEFTSNIVDMKTCDLVIEAIIENESIKADVFKKLDELLPETAISGSVDNRTFKLDPSKLQVETEDGTMSLLEAFKQKKFRRGFYRLKALYLRGNGTFFKAGGKRVDDKDLKFRKSPD